MRYVMYVHSWRYVCCLAAIYSEQLRGLEPEQLFDWHEKPGGNEVVLGVER